jgi:transposase
MNKQDRPVRKRRPVYAYPFKIKLVEEIENGYLSQRYASIKYHVSRSTLDDWLERYGKHHKRMKKKNMSPEKKIKQQHERILDLELMVDIQREMIAEMELITGKELSKKYLPKQWADAVEKIKRDKLASK